MRFQFSKGVLQLDELVAAIGSPIGAAAEDQQQPVWSHQFVQRPVPAMLIGQREIGNLRADLGTGPVAVVLGLDELRASRRGVMSFPPAANLRIIS